MLHPKSPQEKLLERMAFAKSVIDKCQGVDRERAINYYTKLGLYEEPEQENMPVRMQTEIPT
jgi:hypothetical protein